MIVTRTRKRRWKITRLIAPVVLVALMAAAFAWQPSRDRLHAFPPIGKAMDAVAAAADVGSLHRTIDGQKREIANLQKQIAGLQGSVQSRDKQISALTTRANQLDQQLAGASRETVAPRPATSAGIVSSDDSAQVERTAKIWNEMEPQAAAKIAERLPDEYVARVFAAMDPDQVAEILGAMPPKVAARLTATRANSPPKPGT